MSDNNRTTKNGSAVEQLADAAAKLIEAGNTQLASGQAAIATSIAHSAFDLAVTAAHKRLNNGPHKLRWKEPNKLVNGIVGHKCQPLPGDLARQLKRANVARHLEGCNDGNAREILDVCEKLLVATSPLAESTTDQQPPPAKRPASDSLPAFVGASLARITRMWLPR